MNGEKWVLTKLPDGGKIYAKERWLRCPVCGNRRFFHVLPTTVGKDIPVYCRKCKREYSVNIP